MNLLEMNHVKKSFGGLEVIRDISLHVGEGEIVSIIGPSGSGKSTLLNMMAGLAAAVRYYAGNHGQRRADISGRAGSLEQ